MNLPDLTQECSILADHTDVSGGPALPVESPRQGASFALSFDDALRGVFSRVLMSVERGQFTPAAKSKGGTGNGGGGTGCAGDFRTEGRAEAHSTRGRR